MTETMSLPALGESAAKHTRTVYFIDDSATMREVIKIAFRRENINVITCADAASALAQFDQDRPDIVITDVIMPDQDGYSLCSQIKQHPEFGGIPVLLMSGVVNKSVADKAITVKADELIRKPFQPQELIARVKNFLDPKEPSEAPAPKRPPASAVLSSVFSPPPASAPARMAASPDSAWPRGMGQEAAPQPSAPPRQQAPSAPANFAAVSPDAQKLRMEVIRLNMLVKKLQAELQGEREYNQAMEAQIQALMQME